MIRSIVFPRVMGRSLEDLQPALALFRALGFAAGNEWHEGGNHGVEMLAPSGGVELIAAPDAPPIDATVEVADADAAFEIVKKLIAGPTLSGPTLSSKEGEKEGAAVVNGDPTLSPKSGDEDGAPSGVTIHREIHDTPYGARLFVVEAGGMRIGFLTYAKKPGDSRGMEGRLDARGKKFAIVVSRFNSFITERLLDGALQALRQCGTKAEDINIVHVPGAFEIPSAARQLAESGKYHAVVCIGCLLRGGTLHYEVIANEVTRGVGQSAQETGVPHAFGVLTCDTLEQAIDRSGLKAGNKGFEAGLAAVEMVSLRDMMPRKRTRPSQKKARTGHPDSSSTDDSAHRDRVAARGETADPSTPLRSAQDDNSKSGTGVSAQSDTLKSTADASPRDDNSTSEAGASAQDDNLKTVTATDGSR